MLNKRNKGFTLIEFFIIMLIISTLASMASPYIHKTDNSLDDYECYNNRKMLFSAIEMYNMDNSPKIESIIPGLDFENCEKKLIENHYIKKAIQPSIKGCSYGYININGSDTVFCKYHGIARTSIGETPKPFLDYDINQEKPFSPSYNDFRNKIINEKIKKKNHNDFMTTIGDFFKSPAFIYSNVFLLIISIIIALIKKKKKTS